MGIGEIAETHSGTCVQIVCRSSRLFAAPLLELLAMSGMCCTF